MNENLYTILCLFGGLLTSIDILVGKDRLLNFEKKFKNILFYMKFGDIFNSTICDLIWRIISFPLGIFKGENHALYSIKNKDKMRKIIFHDYSDYYVLMDIGTTNDDWDSILNKNKIKLYGYYNFYPNKVDDFVKLISGAPSNSKKGKYIDNIYFLGPGILQIDYANSKKDLGNKSKLIIAHIEPYYQIGKYEMQIPINPLFTILYDNILLKAITAINLTLKVFDKKDYNISSSSKDLNSLFTGDSKDPNLIQHFIFLFISMLSKQLLNIIKLIFQVFEKIISLIEEVFYFILAIIYNLIIYTVVLPLFSLFYLLMMPFKGSYFIATFFNLESYIKLIGLVIFLIGGLLYLFI